MRAGFAVVVALLLLPAPAPAQTVLSYPDVIGRVGQPLQPVAPVLPFPLTVFSVDPALPAGLALDPVTGVVSGTPSAPSESTHTVAALDLIGATVTAPLRVRIDLVELPAGLPGQEENGLDVPTPPMAELPPPEIGETANAVPLSLGVLIQLPGAKTFAPLITGTQVPMGSVLDTRTGTVQLSIENSRGSVDTATFYGGVFRLTQAADVATLTLRGGSFRACPRARRASTSAVKVVRRLWARGSGAFRTSGRYAVATIRGTTWLTADRCDGTLVRVTDGRVGVRDLARRKTVVVRAGRRYLARPR